MWPFLAITACVISFWLLLRYMAKLPDFPTRLLLFAIWFRYTIHAFPDQTILMSVAGFTVAALFSIATIWLLFLSIELRFLYIRYLGPIYAMIGTVIFSGIMNFSFGGLVDETSKWLYLIFMATLFYRGILLFGVQKISRGLALVLINPLLLQVLSILFNNPKIGNDNSLSYIGGWIHESPFSMVLFTFICAINFINWGSNWKRVALTFLGLLLIFLANYRSTVIATIPIVLVTLLAIFLRLWAPQVRLAVLAVTALSLTVFGSLLWNNLPERYRDVIIFSENPTLFLKSPHEFTERETLLFSGRIQIWSIYLNNYRNGTLVQQMIGFGGQSWKGAIRTQPHSGFISSLYEFGAIGLGLYIFIVISNLLLCFKIQNQYMCSSIAAAQFGLIVLSLADRPISYIEGMIAYAFLLGSCWALQPTRRPTAGLRPTLGSAKHGRLRKFSKPKESRSGPTPHP